MTYIFILDGNPGLFVAVFGTIALLVVVGLAVVLRDMWLTFRGRR